MTSCVLHVLQPIFLVASSQFRWRMRSTSAPPSLALFLTLTLTPIRTQAPILIQPLRLMVIQMMVLTPQMVQGAG